MQPMYISDVLVSTQLRQKKVHLHDHDHDRLQGHSGQLCLCDLKANFVCRAQVYAGAAGGTHCSLLCDDGKTDAMHDCST